MHACGAADQIQTVLGSEQVNALPTKIGVDPSQVSHFFAEYLLNVVDKLYVRMKSCVCETWIGDSCLQWVSLKKSLEPIADL